MEIDLTSKCRVCLSDGTQMNHLFQELEQGVSLLEIFKSTTKFELDEHASFSHLLCQNCSSTIIEFYNLKSIYTENENQIKALLENTEIQAIPEDEPGEKITVKIEFSEDDDDDDDKDIKHEVIAPDDSYSCPHCSDFFLQKNDLREHITLWHPSGTSPKPVELDCKKCNLWFNTPSEVHAHSRCHKRFICDVCGKGFMKKSYLKDHQEVHSTNKTYTCTFCQKSFRRRTCYVKHRRLHTNPREYICEICGKAFNDTGTLRTHISLLHIRNRDYKCMICGLAFPLKGTLDKHILRHDIKERVFTCSQCAGAYKDKSSLDRHIFLKHSGKNIEVQCHTCGRSYTTRGSLRKHQRNIHGIGIKKEVDEADDDD